MNEQEAPEKLRRRYDLVVFDWDGTLADSTSMIAAALQSACRDIGCAVPADRDARFVIGLGLADALRHVAPQLEADRHPQLSAHYRRHFLAHESAIPLFEGARELLDSLRASGRRLAVATGKSRVGLDRTLAHHGLRDIFDATRCADEGRPKPHPDMLHYLMRTLDVPPERTLMVGDTTHDLMMAVQAGVDFAAVSHGAHEAEMLAEASCGVHRSLADLLDAVLGDRR